MNFPSLWARRTLALSVITCGALSVLPGRAVADEAQFQEDCGTPQHRQVAPVFGVAPDSPDDCSATSTRAARTFFPSTPVLTIPVVVHVIMDATCAMGVVSDDLVHSQIQVLNEDFGAMAGTNGASGANTHIQFELATTDPNGNATTGITRDCNTTWYNDTGDYFNTLAWDPFHYMNIYTNTAAGARGYVPFLPADGGGSMVGTPADRVVINYLAFGKPGPTPPYDLGRTTTHEVGHFVGVYHPFLNGCGTPTQPGCLTTGDLICDTSPDEMLHHGCATGQTNCGGLPIPADDYMEYSDDSCMTHFSNNQARRQRCTLAFYRQTLPRSTSDPVNWLWTATTPYAGLGLGTGVSEEQQGTALHLTGDVWRKGLASFTITANTMLAFEFESGTEGEIHGIGFDENDNANDAPRVFQVFGTEAWPNALPVASPYTNADLGTYKSYQIPVGQHYTGPGFHLVLVNDKDSGLLNNESRFRNVRVFEAPPLHDADKGAGSTEADNLR